MSHNNSDDSSLPPQWQHRQEQLDALREQVRVEYISEQGGTKGGGNPPGGGNLEARVAQLEAHAEYIRRDLDAMRGDIGEIKKDISSIRTTDFRITFGAIITVALGLSALMAKGFGWI